MKKLLAILMTSALVLSGCGASSPKNQAKEALKKDISLTWLTSSVRNDSTGERRVAECLTDQQPTVWAKLYYEGYFESDDEIHAIVNFTLNTTNAIKVQGDKIVIDVHDHVKGEEHDAKLLFSGELLDTQYVKK